MKFDGGKIIFTLAGVPVAEGEKTITVGQTLATSLMAVINDPAQTKLTTKQMYELAKKLFTSTDVELSPAEVEVCKAIANHLPLKLSYPCLEALEE